MKKLSILLCLLTLALCGCTMNSSQAEKTTQQIFALDTLIDITAYGENAQAGILAAKNEITRLEKLFSTTLPESEIAKMNQNPQDVHTVSQETASVMETALDTAKKSGGALDPSVYPIVKLWGFTTDSYRVPSESEIEHTLPLVDYKKIVFDKTARTVTLAPAMQIDLGAAAKGYIAGQAAQAMKKSGVQSAVINLGGNVQTVGALPDGNQWSIGIEYPNTNTYFCKIKLGEIAAITSGAYQRKFEQNGVSYHHIMDPKTGKPAESSIASVTVIASDGTLADALSTTFFILDVDKAAEYYRTYGGFDFVLLTKDNAIYATQGVKDKITPADGYEDFPVHIIYK